MFWVYVAVDRRGLFVVRIASDLVSDSGHVLQTCGNMVEEHEAPF